MVEVQSFFMQRSQNSKPATVVEAGRALDVAVLYGRGIEAARCGTANRRDRENDRRRGMHANFPNQHTQNSKPATVVEAGRAVDAAVSYGRVEAARCGIATRRDRKRPPPGLQNKTKSRETHVTIRN